MNIKTSYLVIFFLAVVGVVVLSLPTTDTLVELNIGAGNTGHGIALLEREYAKDPNNFEIALRLAGLYGQNGDLRSQAVLLRRLLDVRPDDLSIQRNLAQALVGLGEMDEAMAVLPEERRDRAFNLNLADYQEKEGNLPAAEAALLKAWEGAGDDIGMWLRLAKWRRDFYNLSGEAEALRKALAIDPMNAEAWHAYFTNRAWIPDPAEAGRAANRLWELGAATRAELQIAKNFRFAARDLAGAAEFAQKIADLDDGTPEDRVEEARLLYLAENAPKADRILLAMATAPGISPELAGQVSVLLRSSAQRERNLDLVLRLASISPDPTTRAESAILAIDLAIATNRLEEVENLMAPLLAAPDASPAILRAGLHLASRRGDSQAATVLLSRLAAAGEEVDGVLADVLGGIGNIAELHRQTALRPDNASAWLALARAESLAGNAPETAAAVDAGLPLMERDSPLDAFAAVEALAYLSVADAGGAAERRRRLEQALDVLGTLAGGPLERSRWYLAAASDINNRLGRTEEAGRYWTQLSQLYPNDPIGSLGLLRLAATRGDEEQFRSLLTQLKARPELDNAAGIQEMAYSTLEIADYFRERDPERSRAWLATAADILDGGRGKLSETDMDALQMMANVNERLDNWSGALANWRSAARITPNSVEIQVGIARAATQMGDGETAWYAIEAAAALNPTDPALRLQIAWEYLSAADAAAPDNPARAQRAAKAEAYADTHLAAMWDNQLATALYWRALDAGNLDKARRLTLSLEGMTPEMHVGLAEALLANDQPEDALQEALIASSATDRTVLIRAAYIISHVGGRERTQDILSRLEGVPGEENDSPERMLLLADAYGFVDNFERQYELSERRARLAGGETEWFDAVDRHLWHSDFNGAIALLGLMNEANPASPRIVSQLLAILADINRPGRVVEVYSRARQANPDIDAVLSGDALAALGTSYDDLRSPQTARTFFRASLEKEAANKRASMGLARLFRREGRLDASTRTLQEYAMAFPDDPWGWLELANSRRDSNQSGRSDYSQVLALTEPDQNGEIPRDVRAARAVALRQLGREQEARALLLATMGPIIDNPNVPCDYAEMLMSVGRNDEAEEILRETAAVFPYHIWAYRLEATSLVRRQKYDKAVERLREALRWSPNDGEVQRDLAFAAQMWERTWPSQKAWLTAGGR